MINKDGHIGVVTKAGKPVQKVSSLRAGGLSISNSKGSPGVVRSSAGRGYIVIGLDLLSQ